jgi:tRNA pseudouridine55 synthase
MTSHDVVARARRVLSVRRVGHAGTLDPMATGLLVLGVGAATRLLGYVGGHDKTYEATMRLGQSTVTDDREGEVLATTSTAHLGDAAVTAALAAQAGPLLQVPSSVSAVKVAGPALLRPGARGRGGRAGAAGGDRPPLDVHRVVRPTPDLVDVDVTVTCTAGTYVRAIARDAGAALGVGGHLTALRRTASGPFS